MLLDFLSEVNWTVGAMKEMFIATVLKQEKKILQDQNDVKGSDIDFIKKMYPSFEGKTEDTDRVYNLILETFPE